MMMMLRLVALSAMCFAGLSACSHLVFADRTQANLNGVISKAVRKHVSGEPLTAGRGRLYLVSSDGTVVHAADTLSFEAAATTLDPDRASCTSGQWQTALYISPAGVGSPGAWYSCAQVDLTRQEAAERIRIENALLQTMQVSLYLDKLYDAQSFALAKQSKAIVDTQRHAVNGVVTDRKMLSTIYQVREAVEQHHRDIKKKLAALKANIEAIK